MTSFYRIESAKDLPDAIKFANGDGGGVKFRWYVARMAKAYGKSDLVPEEWNVDTSSAEFRVRSEEELQQNSKVDQAVDALADTAGKVVDGEVEADQAASDVEAIMASARRAGITDEVEQAWSNGLDVLVADGSLTAEQREALTAASVGGAAKKTVKKVRTLAGVKRYGAPIGTPIVRDAVTGKLKADLANAPKGKGGKIGNAEKRKASLDADRAKVAEIRKSDRAVASDGETLRDVEARIQANKKGLDSDLADGDEAVAGNRIATDAKIERTPIEDLAEGDELHYQAGTSGATSRVVEKVTPRSDGGYDLVVSDSEGRETSHTIPKGSQLRKVYGADEEPEYLSRGTVKDRMDRDVAGVKAEKQRLKSEGVDPKNTKYVGKDALVDTWLAGLKVDSDTYKTPAKWKAPKGTNLDDKTPIKRGDKAFGVKYKDMDGNDAEGVFWADGPDANTAWITTKDPETGKNGFKLVAKGTGGKGEAREVKNLDTMTGKIPSAKEAEASRKALERDAKWLTYEARLKDAERIKSDFKSAGGTQRQREMYDQAVLYAERAKPTGGVKLTSDERGAHSRVVATHAAARQGGTGSRMSANPSTNSKNFMTDVDMADDDTADMPSLFDEPAETPKPKAEAPKPTPKAEAPKPEPKAAESKPEPTPEPEKPALSQENRNEIVDTREVGGVEERVRRSGTIERGNYLIVPTKDGNFQVMENFGSYRLNKATFSTEALARKRADRLTKQEADRKAKDAPKPDAPKAGTKVDAPKADAPKAELSNRDKGIAQALSTMNDEQLDKFRADQEKVARESKATLKPNSTNPMDHQNNAGMRQNIEQSENFIRLIDAEKAKRAADKPEQVGTPNAPETDKVDAKPGLMSTDQIREALRTGADIPQVFGGDRREQADRIKAARDRIALTEEQTIEAGFEGTNGGPLTRRRLAAQRADEILATDYSGYGLHTKGAEERLANERSIPAKTSKSDAPEANAPETPSDPWDADITIEHTPDGGTIIHGTEKGSPAVQVLKDNGFRWSRNLGQWYLPRSRDQRPNQAKIDRLGKSLEGAGFSVGKAVENDRRSAADREAAKVERANERTEALVDKVGRKAEAARVADQKHRDASDALPWGGEPIKVGHHSEGRHRRAIEKSWNALGKSVEADEAVKETARRAEVSAIANESRNNPVTVGNRIDTIRADISRLEKRNLSDSGKDSLADLKDDLSYWSDVRAKQIEDGLVPDANPETVKVGDLVGIKGRGKAKVTKVNKTTLDVVVDEKTGRSLNYKFHEVTSHTPVEGGEPEKPADFSMAPHRAHTRITKANLADGEKTVRNGMERKGFTVHKDYTVTDSDGGRHLRYLGDRPGTLDGARAAVDKMAVDRETLGGRNSPLMGKSDGEIERMISRGNFPDGVTRSDAEKVLKGREGFTPDTNSPRAPKPAAAAKAAPKKATPEAPKVDATPETPDDAPTPTTVPERREEVTAENFTMATPEEQGEDLMGQYAVKYRDDKGEMAEGVFWSPGPTDRTAWITHDTPGGGREFVLVDKAPGASGLKKVEGGSQQMMVNNAPGKRGGGATGDKARTNFMDKFISRGTESQRKAVADAQATSDQSKPATADESPSRAALNKDRGPVNFNGKAYGETSSAWALQDGHEGALALTPDGWLAVDTVKTQQNGKVNLTGTLVDSGKDWKGKVDSNTIIRKPRTHWNAETKSQQVVTPAQAAQIDKIEADKRAASGNMYNAAQDVAAQKRIDAILNGRPDPGVVSQDTVVRNAVRRINSTTDEFPTRGLGTGRIIPVSESLADRGALADAKVEMPDGVITGPMRSMDRAVVRPGYYAVHPKTGAVVRVTGKDEKPRSTAFKAVDPGTGKAANFSVSGRNGVKAAPAMKYTSGPSQGEPMSRADVEKIAAADNQLARMWAAPDPGSAAEQSMVRQFLDNEVVRVRDEVNANPSVASTTVTTSTSATPAATATPAPTAPEAPEAPEAPSGAFVPDMSGYSAEQRAEVEKHVARADAIKEAAEALNALPQTPDHYYERKKLVDNLQSAKRMETANQFTLGTYEDTPTARARKKDLTRIDRERKVPNPSTKLGTKPTTLTDDMVEHATMEEIGAHAKDVREAWAKRLTREQRNEHLAAIGGDKVMRSTKFGDQTKRKNYEKLHATLVEVNRVESAPKRNPADVSDREVLDMLVGEHLSTTEVAQYLGIPKNDAYKRLNRLREGNYLDSMENGNTEQENYGKLVRGKDGSLSKPVSGDRSRVEDLWWSAGFDDGGEATDRLNRWDRDEAAADAARIERAKSRASGAGTSVPRNAPAAERAQATTVTPPAEKTAALKPTAAPVEGTTTPDASDPVLAMTPREHLGQGVRNGTHPFDLAYERVVAQSWATETPEEMAEALSKDLRDLGSVDALNLVGDDGQAIRTGVEYQQQLEEWVSHYRNEARMARERAGTTSAPNTPAAPSAGLTDADGDPVSVGSEGFRLGQGYQQWKVTKVNEDGTVDLAPVGPGKRNRIGVDPSRLKKHGASAPANRAVEATPTLTTGEDAGLFTVGRGGKKWRIASVNTDGTVNLVGESGEGRQRWSVDRSKLRSSSNEAPRGAATGDSLGTDALGGEVTREKTYRLGRGSQVWKVDVVNPDGTLDLAPVGGDRGRKRLAVDPARLKATDAPAPKRGRPRKDRGVETGTMRDRIDSVKARAEGRASEAETRAEETSAAVAKVLNPDTPKSADPTNVLTDRVFKALSGVHRRKIDALEGKSTLTEDERNELSSARSSLNKLHEEYGIPPVPTPKA